MARRIAFSPYAWDGYLHWQQQDRRILDRINVLLQACARDPFTGIGKPEPLKRELAGCWSRRIDQAHRLVYRVDADSVEVISCRYHYGDR